jgi:hypothetical protein
MRRRGPLGTREKVIKTSEEKDGGKAWREGGREGRMRKADAPAGKIVALGGI